MRAASVCVNITPEGTFYMEGYGHPVRKEPALGVHDAPQAVMLLLGEGDNEVLFVSLDVCIVTEGPLVEMREGLSRAVGISGEHVVISAIHSHSCPTGFEGRNGLVNRESPGYVPLTTGRVLAAATRLREALVEVRTEFLSTRVRGWYSNRNDPDRPFDDAAHALRFISEEGVVVGAMLNFNCHATVVGPLNRYLTADVVGGVRAELAEWIGIVPYTFTGASADLGNRQFRQGNDFAELRRISNGIAGEVMRAHFSPLDLSEPAMSTFTYHVNYNNEAYYPSYRRQFEEVNARLSSGLSFDEKKLADTEREILMAKLEIHEMAFPIKISVIDLGAVVLVAFPGELASDLGMRIKAMFAGRTVLIVGYANDYQGYFVPEEDFGGTSYESYVTQMPVGGIERVLDAFEEQL